MNSSFESTINKTNYVMRELNIENDTNTMNTNLSYLNPSIIASNKLLFKNTLFDNKRRGSFLVSNSNIFKEGSSIGLMLKKEEDSKIRNKIINLNKDKYEDSWINIVSSDISKIVLIKVVDQCYFEGHLHLKNNLNTEYILAKFINNKNCYTITPSLFFIKPRSEIYINIKRFYKLGPDESNIRENDNILMIVGKNKNEIEDLNDVKVYLRSEDIYSQDQQLFSFSLILDNGYNPIYFEKLVEQRKKKMELFYSQTNINEIKDPKLIVKHIQNLQIKIQEYKQKIKNEEKQFDLILENSLNKNLNRQNSKGENNNKIIFDEEVFYEIKDKKEQNKKKDNSSYNKLLDIIHDEDGITIPMLLFGFSICLFIGKFLRYVILS